MRSYIYIYLFICAFKNHWFIHLFIYLFFNIRTYIHMIRHMIDYCVQVCIYICVLERERGGKKQKKESKQGRKERKAKKERKEGKNDILLSCWLAALRALDSLYSWISQFLYHRQRLFSSRLSDRLRSIQSTCTVKPNCFSVQSWARGVQLDIYSYS